MQYVPKSRLPYHPYRTHEPVGELIVLTPELPEDSGIAKVGVVEIILVNRYDGTVKTAFTRAVDEARFLIERLKRLIS